jgi:hypothetical protein
VLGEPGRDTGLFVVEATDRLGETDRPGRNLITSAGAGQQDCWNVEDNEDNARMHDG